MSAERGGRYERSFGGMVGALIITLLAIIGFVIFRAVVRDDLEVKRETVEYETIVQAFQQGGDTTVAYPQELPKGWRAVGAGLSSDGGWMMDALTEDDEWSVGLRQERRSVPEMLRIYINDDGRAEADGTVTVDGELGGEWQVYRDVEDGDYALVREVDDRNLIVFSRASEATVKTYAGSLTQELLPEQKPATNGG